MIRLFHQYVSFRIITLFVVESALGAVSIFWSARLRFLGNPGEYEFFLDSLSIPLQIVPRVALFQTSFLCAGMYNARTLNNLDKHILALINALAAAFLLLGGIYYVFPGTMLGRGVTLISCLLFAALVVVLRAAVNAAWGIAGAPRNTLIVGTESLAREVAYLFGKRRDLGVRVVGFVGTTPEMCGEKLSSGHPVLGVMDDLEALVRKHDVTNIVVALENRRGVLPIQRLVRLRFEGLGIEDANDTLAALSGRVSLKTIHPSWFVFSDGFRRHVVVMAVKRLLDLISAALCLLVTLPLMALLAVLVWLDSGGPILYRQVRVGLRGRPFELLKFRSMVRDAEESGKPQWAADNDPRITRVGKWLRKFRLDELPQFINIIRGEMSFIGPRPERPEFVERLRGLIIYYDERHMIRPGLTGWAQVMYSYGATDEEAYRKLEYDLFYLKNMSVGFDLLILAKTLRIVLTGHGSR